MLLPRGFSSYQQQLRHSALVSAIPRLLSGCRTYYHTVPADLVPEGQRASRFHSNTTPTIRSRTTLDYLLAPAQSYSESAAESASVNQPAAPQRIATLAVPIKMPQDFFKMKKRQDRHQRYHQSTQPSSSSSSSGLVSSLTDCVGEALPPHGVKIVTSTLMGPRMCPWHRANVRSYLAAVAANFDLVEECSTHPGSNNAISQQRHHPVATALSRIEPWCYGIEVSVDLSELILAEEKKEEEKEAGANKKYQDKSEKEGHTKTTISISSSDNEERKLAAQTATTSDHGGMDDTKVDELASLVVRLQSTLLDAVSAGRLADPWGICVALPDGMPLPPETEVGEFCGEVVTQSRVDEGAARYRRGHFGVLR